MRDDKRLGISITLSPVQVEEVVSAASRRAGPSLSTLIANSLHASIAPEGAVSVARNERGEAAAERLPGCSSARPDPKLSQALLRGLSILACFRPHGKERGIVELADDLGMSPSTTHRYANTLLEVGLLERCPRTRKYRLPGV